MIIKTASVKVMLSYDYSHFEASMALESEDGVTVSDMDDARKSCMRLCDKAISQYKIAKDLASKRSDGQFRMQNFENECKRILQKPDGDRTLNEIAMLKQYSDEKWRDRFSYDYDYEDNYQTN